MNHREPSNSTQDHSSGSDATESSDDDDVTGRANLPMPMVTIRRTSSLTCNGYYVWRQEVWQEVYRLLNQPDNTRHLINYYDSQIRHWETHKRTDLAFVAAIRKGVSTMFNIPAQSSLTMLKREYKRLLRLEASGVHIPNLSFVKADLMVVIAMLYIKLNKLGNTWKYLTQASQLLASSESCEFHSDFNYVKAEFHVRLSVIGAGNNPGRGRKLKKQAVQCAKRSRDILDSEKERGDFFSLYAAESMFLYLRALVDADLFASRTILDVREFRKEAAWSAEDIAHARDVIAQVRREYEGLALRYKYYTTGLTKCECIVTLQEAKLLYKNKTTAHIQNAIVLCGEVIDACARTLAQWSSVVCVMSKFVEQTIKQLRSISLIAHQYRDWMKQRLHMRELRLAVTDRDVTSDSELPGGVQGILSSS